MRFCVIDKETREILWHGLCNMDSFDGQRDRDDGKKTVRIHEPLDMRRKYRMWPDGVIEDVGLSDYGKVMAARE